MSIIQGGSDFPKKQPVPGKPLGTPKTEETSSSPPITDGLVLSGSGLSEPVDYAQTGIQPSELRRRDPDLGVVKVPMAEDIARKPLNVLGFEACLMAEVDGQFLTGPGVGNVTASNRVSESVPTAGVSEFAFANGIHSRQLIGISGQVLADANPFLR